MPGVRDLPALSAVLNALSATLLAFGYAFIRQGLRRRHMRAMLAACCTSALFLASYVIYHAQVGSVRFQKTGAIRTVYLAILATHSLLAAVLPVLVVLTLVRALRGRFDRHRAIARWTLPVWFYVSVTGVVIYWMLYRM